MTVRRLFNKLRAAFVIAMLKQKSNTAGYSVSTDKRRLQVSVIHKFLRSSYWAADIPRSVVVRSIRHSLCFGVYFKGEQVGFARVITDRATFAYLADVFLLPEHRARGVGKKLIRHILAHRDLQGLRRILLATQDAHKFYMPLGFKPLAHPERYLTIGRGNPYQKSRPVKRRSAP
jgi:GNAT superfamily N-acetyltransferase